MINAEFSQGVLEVLKNLNKVPSEGKGYLPFYVDNIQVGLIRPDFWTHMQKYSNVLQFVGLGTNNKSVTDEKQGVHLSQNYKSYQERSDAVNGMLEDLRKKDVISALRGWRHEMFRVTQKYTDVPCMEVERAGACLFGFIQYGVQVNGYTKDKNGNLLMWIGRRSKTKQTFPDMYDNLSAGGLPAGMGVLDCVRKECQEEASVPDDLLDKLKFVGNISAGVDPNTMTRSTDCDGKKLIHYFYEDELGLFPECQFLYDLELPDHFNPVNTDGEVSEFQKQTVSEVKQLLIGGEFPPACAAVCLDFLIRHGFLCPDSDPNISNYVEQLHAPLQSYYSR